MSNLVLLVLLALPGQDLIERDRALRRSLSPAVAFPEAKAKPVSVDFSAEADFGCGSFDLKASFQSLFNKNVKEEYLNAAWGTIQKELAGSALVLACYASPTVCDALKHYRVSTQAMLEMEMNACRAVEDSLDDTRRRAKARAIKECLDEKARQGRPLDEARRECRRATELRGLEGKAVREIDLVKDLGLPASLVPPLKMGPGTLHAETRATQVVEAYESERKECLEAWEKAIQDPLKAELEKLGPVARAEVERIALMEPSRREATVRSLASATALARLTRETQEVERTLESAELTAPSEVRAELERRRVLLRNEIARLAETFETERRLERAVAEAGAAAEADLARKARERLAPRRSGNACQTMMDRTRAWGCDTNRRRGSEIPEKNLQGGTGKIP